VRSAQLHQGPINDVEFHTGGGNFFTCGDDKLVVMWNTGDMKEARRFDGPAAPQKTLARSANGQLLVAGGADNFVRLWNIGGQPLAQAQSAAAILDVAIQTEGKKIIALCGDNVIRNYGFTQVAGKNELPLGQECSGHAAAVTAVALSPDGAILFSTSADKSLKRWLPANQAMRFNLGGHNQHIYALAFAPNGQRLASAGADNIIKLWNTTNGQNYANCQGHTAQVYGVAWHPTQDQIISCSGDKSIRFWSGADGKPISELREGITDGLYNLELSPDGSKFVAGGLAKTWLLWPMGQPKPAGAFPGHSDHIYRVAYNPQGNRVATLGYAGTLMIWDESGKVLAQQSLPVKAAYSLDYSPDGKELAIATSDPRVLIVTVPQQAL
jgi:WD40 repeat protein